MHARLCYQLDDIISLHCHSISLLFCFLLLLLSLINIQTHIIFCHLEFFPLRKNGDGNQHLRYQMDQFSHHGKCFLPSRVIFMLPRFNFELHFSKTRYAFNKFKSFHYSKKKKWCSLALCCCSCSCIPHFSLHLNMFKATIFSS